MNHPFRPRIVCLGDSLTSCGGDNGRYSDYLQIDFPDYEVVNRGIGGDTLGGGLARLDSDVLAFHPVLVIVALGANDYWKRERSLNDLARDYEAIVSRCRTPQCPVILASCFGNDPVPPDLDQMFDQPGVPLEAYAAGLATIERRLVERYRCEYIPDMQIGITPKGRADLWNDSNHPNAFGNRIVASTFLPAIHKALKELP